MVFDGLNGLNFNGMGESAENILATCQRTGGRFQLVRNEPKAVTMLAKAGFSVIYRQTNDDPAANPLARDPADFGNELVTNAPDAAYYHATNEIEGEDVHRWTGELLKWANDDPRKPKFVIYNYGTNKDVDVWEAAKANIELAAKTGHAIGVHLYDDGEHLDGAYHWLALKRAIGGLWMYTEIGYIKSIFSPYDGWIGHINEDRYIEVMEMHSKIAYRENMPAIWFSFDEWPIGGAHPFMLKNSPRMIGTLARLNVLHKYADDWTPPKPEPPAPIAWQPRTIITAIDGADFRKQASASAPFWELLLGNKTFNVDYDPAGDVAEDEKTWKRFRINEDVGYIRFPDAADWYVETPVPEPVPTPTPAVVVWTADDARMLELAALNLQRCAVELVKASETLTLLARKLADGAKDAAA